MKMSCLVRSKHEKHVSDVEIDEIIDIFIIFVSGERILVAGTRFHEIEWISSKSGAQTSVLGSPDVPRMAGRRANIDSRLFLYTSLQAGGVYFRNRPFFVGFWRDLTQKLVFRSGKLKCQKSIRFSTFSTFSTRFHRNLSLRVEIAFLHVIFVFSGSKCQHFRENRVTFDVFKTFSYWRLLGNDVQKRRRKGQFSTSETPFSGSQRVKTG